MVDEVPLEPLPADDFEALTLFSPGPDEKAWTELSQAQFLAGYADADGVYDTRE